MSAVPRYTVGVMRFGAAVDVSLTVYFDPFARVYGALLHDGQERASISQERAVILLT